MQTKKQKLSPFTTEVDNKINELSEQLHARLIDIRQQVDILQQEEGCIMDKIRQLTGAKMATLARKARKRVRRASTPATRAVMQVVREAGDGGITSSEIIEMVGALTPGVDRGHIFTLLSKMKSRGQIHVAGPRGEYRYFTVEAT